MSDYFVKVISAATGAGVYNCSFVSIDATNFGEASGEKMADFVAPAWELGKVYAINDFVMGTDSKPYRCYNPHTATNDDKPVTGANWADYWELADSIEVLNLREGYTIALPERALAAGDRMKIWQMADDGDPSTLRWVGIPQMISSVRRAKLTENAGTDQFVTCNLMGYDGNEVATGLGSGITVNFKANQEGTPTSWQPDQTCPRLDSGDMIEVENHSGKWWFISNLGKSEDKPL